MICVDENERWSSAQCLEHQWFTDANKNLEEPVPVEIRDEIFEALKSFNTSSRLHKTVLHMLVKMISHKELSELKAAFHAIDTSNSGVIDVNELRAAAKKCSLNISDEELDDIIVSVQHDLDNNDIEYCEFMAATISP